MNTISYISIPEHVEGKISLNPQPSSLRSSTARLLPKGRKSLILTRTKIKGEFCEGRLTINGIRICDTLENAQCRVPAGIYPITLIKCKHHARKMPVLNAKCPCDRCPRSLRSQPSSLNSVLPCYCPMLKSGNGIHKRLDGSILVGRNSSLGCIIHPQAPFDSLYERIRKSISRGNTVTLTISDPPK